ncbi:MAG: hypothetical protein J5903_00685 [Clostridia bacterium]|nr:hypothetical protein [Clostridia bacterium]
MLKFLPPFVIEKLKNFPLNAITEIRIRAGIPIKAIINRDGKIATETLGVSMGAEDIERAMMKLSNYTLFSVEESLKRGFITSGEGERVGVCGECVTSLKAVSAVKNVTSLCVRFPHDVIGCAEKFFREKLRGEAKSCLIISPPFQGKTTFIRDLGRTVSDKLGLNVLFIDERDELGGGGRFYLGENADVMRYASKSYAFAVGIRNLHPDVIVCDELMDEEDCKAAEFAALSGVKVIATVHAASVGDVIKKENFKRAAENSVFDVYAELKNFNVKKVYDGRFNEI